MKVKELILKLQKCDQELDVFASYGSDNPLTDSIEVSSILQITMCDKKEENMVVLRLGE
ncbi:hypothetical protein ABFP60_01960 [Clostridioides difficile]